MHSSHVLSQAEHRLAEILETLERIPVLAAKAKKPRAPGSRLIVNLAFVLRKPMQELNFRHRGKKVPTDVLSFEAPSPFREAGVLGDLVICTPVLRAQALSEKTGLALELDILMIHGVLHLLGFDHEKGPQAAKEMAMWEARLLDELGAFGSAGKGLGLIARAASGKKRK